MSADIIIIGSGVASTAIASTLLCEKPDTKILILEAGEKIQLKNFGLFQNFLIDGKLPYDSEFIYDAHADLPYGAKDHAGENDQIGEQPIQLAGSRLFAYGGSTTHWGGWAFRLKPEDFHAQETVKSAVNWPFSYNDLERYYCDAESFLGVSGSKESTELPEKPSRDYPYLAFPFTKEDGLIISAFDKLGMTYSHLPIARYGKSDKYSTKAPCQTTGTCKYCPFGSRFAAANDLDELCERAENLEVRTGMVVQQITRNNRKAESLTCYNRRSGQTETLTAKLIIVAAGAIESTKLLLRSSIGNRKHLGAHYVTHPFFNLSATIPNTKDSYQPQMGFPTLVSRHFDTVDEQAEGKFIILHPHESPMLNLANELANGSLRTDVQHKMRHNLRIKLHGMVEVFSDEKSYIESGYKLNRFGMYDTIVSHSSVPSFSSRIAYIQKQVNDIFKAAGAVNPKIETTTWRADHSACTTRMSEIDEDGVVDSNLRVHDMDNIYICSNSTFPNIGAVNPTLTLTALAIRLAEHLLTIL